MKDLSGQITAPADFTVQAGKPLKLVLLAEKQHVLIVSKAQFNYSFIKPSILNRLVAYWLVSGRKCA